MIETFGCKYTEKVWNGVVVRKWSEDIANRALSKLFILNASVDIKDLTIPPSNRLHKLKGNMAEYWSISINSQWRIIFMWSNSNAYDVQIIDYH